MSTELKLNAEQLAAVQHVDGPLRLIAGAGTGKTRTLTERVAHIVRSGRAEPGQILALTFTEKAAAEMAERIHGTTRLLSQQRVSVATYNAFGGSVVEEHGHLLGLPPALRVLTPSESWITLWQAIERDEIEFKALDMFGLRGRQSPIARILKTASRLKDELAAPGALVEYSGGADAAEDPDEMEDVARAVGVYQRKLHEMGAIDFGDQISLAVDLLRRPEVAAEYAERYRYLLVDEFQDTNYAQSVMVMLLARQHRNVCVVGDPYQAIYGFRGAAPDNVERFVRDFPDAVTMTLTQNYRSTQEILDVANSVWTEDLRSGREQLVSAEGRHGEAVSAAVLPDREAEAAYIAAEVRRLTDTGACSYGEIAVLVRKNELKLEMWRLLRELGIPVEVVGGSDLFRAPEVREIISYLRAIEDPSDTVSLAHALTSRVWAYDEASLLPLALEAGRGTSLLTALKSRAEADPDGGPARRFLAAFERLAALRARVSLPRLIEEAISLRRTCYSAIEEANVRRLKAFASDFAANQVDRVDLADLLSYVDLMSAAGSDEDEAQEVEATDTVKLLTAHAAKGLEWPVVFVAAASDPDFRTLRDKPDVLPAELSHPAAGRPDPEDERAFKQWRKEQQALEDRRVFYVALTRARDRLYVTRSKLPTWYSKDRLPLEFFQQALKLCEQYEVEAEERGGIAPTLRPFAESCIAGRLHEPAAADKVTRAWLEMAELCGLSAAEEKIASALDTWRSNIDRWEQWLEARERREQLRGEQEAGRHRGRPSLSYTQISTFESCNRRYYLKYLQGLPGLPEEWKTRTGSAFHAAVERHARLRMLGSDVRFEQLAGWFRSALDGSTNGSREDESCLWSYWKGPDAQARLLAVEEEFYLPVGESFIHGFIDRIQQLPDGSIEVVDFKTSRRAKGVDEVRADLQLPVYVLACRDVLGLDTELATMFFVRHNRRVTIRYSEAELDAVRLRLERLAAEIASVDPVQVNPAQCRWCEYRLVCSYSSQAVQRAHAPA